MKMKATASLSPKDWTLKAVQMDLARQIEPMDRVLDFFNLAARSGFNAVVLYLEDRIRTESYPYAASGEYYTPQEIRQMVDWAAQNGLELIPVVSNLGHTERFLAHPELSHLSELRGEIAGRFSKAGAAFHNAVCPSLEESYAFFDRYIAEVAALFPGSYFHVGLDEVWNMGYCPLCRARMEAGEELGDLFVSHILRTHRLLRSLGKTMIMWDDLFEHFPEKLEQLPRDIVLCTWNYLWVSDKLQGHFANSVLEDLFDRYDRLGFSYIVGTNSDPYNLDSFTRYAGKHRPLGGLLTIWERETRQLVELYPLVANGGMLWNGLCPDDPGRRMELALTQELGVQLPESLLDALSAAVFFPGGGPGTQMAPVSPFTQVRAQRERTGGYLLRQLEREMALLRQSGPALSRQGWDIVEEYRDKLRSALLAIRLNRLFNQLMDHRSGVCAADAAALSAAFQDCARQLSAGYHRQLDLWSRYRCGLAHPALDSLFRQQLARLEEAAELARSAPFGEIGRLNLRFFLPDGYCAETTAITLLYAGGGTREEKLAEGVYKSPDFSAASSPYYTLSFPISPDRPVAAVRIEAWGYGGVGLTWLETEQKGVRSVPAAIGREEGKISDPQHLLTDDSRWCYLGEPHVNLTFRYGQLAQVRHTLEVLLRPEY